MIIKLKKKNQILLGCLKTKMESLIKCCLLFFFRINLLFVHMEAVVADNMLKIILLFSMGNFEVKNLVDEHIDILKNFYTYNCFGKC